MCAKFWANQTFARLAELFPEISLASVEAFHGMPWKVYTVQMSGDKFL